MPPETTKVASGSDVSTSISTSEVRASRSIESPSVTLIPFTLKSVRKLSSFGATFNVNSYSLMVSPSAAVTTMVSVFSPTTNPLSPSTSKFASISVVST